MAVPYQPDNEGERAAVAAYEELQRITSWPKWFAANANWTTTIIITLLHVLGFYGLWLMNNAMWQTNLFAVVLLPISTLGITAGLHRLYSHRAYKAHIMFRFLLMLLCSISNLSSIVKWVRDHRVHHRYSETEADPHNAVRGFWFSHIGWLYLKRDPRVVFAASKTDMSDVLALPEVRFQMLLYPWWNIFWCLLFPMLSSVHVWGEEPVVGFLVPGVARYIVSIHEVFCVNSVAHLWGERPYDQKLNAAEQPIVSFLTMGEGWHNYHHVFPYCYAASEFGISAQFNPTKLLIDFGAMLGLVWNRRRGLDKWHARMQCSGMQYEVVGVPFFKKRVATKRN